MMIIYRLLSESFIAYGWYIGCYEEPEGYVTSRLIVNNRMYILQVSDGDDPKLLSKIITTKIGWDHFGQEEQHLCGTITAKMHR